MAKKSSYQKLRDEIERIEKERDEWRGALKRNIQGNMDCNEFTTLSIIFKTEDDFEKSVWSGSAGKQLKKGDKLKFHGIVYKVIKSK